MMKYKMVLLVFVATTIRGFKMHEYDGLDFKDHPCDRECGNETMVCNYRFIVEWYYTMSKACYNCPYNYTDCERDHCITCDGNPRPVVSINRQIPGPSIRVCARDTINVLVSNRMENGEGLSIHWHGLYQKETPWMDGANMITQCPIPSGTAFTYRFEAWPPGTHWYHSHTGYQRTDGVFGSFIVKQSSLDDIHRSLYDFDLPTNVVGITDWGSETFHSKLLKFLHLNSTVDIDNAILFSEENTIGNIRRPLFNVEQHKSYRFRLCHYGSLPCPLEIEIDNHVLTVISLDGANVTPYNVTSIVMHSGERVDFVLSANQMGGNYWFRMKADLCNNYHKYGIVRYKGAENKDPDTTPHDPADPNYKKLTSLAIPGDTTMLSITDLEGTDSAAFPRLSTFNQSVDPPIFIRNDFYLGSNPVYNHPEKYPNHLVAEDGIVLTPMLNNVSFSHPPVPLLTQYEDAESAICDPSNDSYNESTHCHDGFCKCLHVMNFPMNTFTDIILYSEGVAIPSLAHPMHLHGYHFYVLAIGRGDPMTDDKIRSMYANSEIKMNTENPVMKDTVVVPAGGYVIIRFLTNNPGVWFFHCHFEIHLELGMAMVFKVGEVSDFKPTNSNLPTCGSPAEP